MIYLEVPKVQKPSEDPAEGGVDQRSIPLQQWKSSHFVAAIAVDLNKINVVRELQVRALYEDHVKALIVSFGRSATVNPKVSFVVCGGPPR